MNSDPILLESIAEKEVYVNRDYNHQGFVQVGDIVSVRVVENICAYFKSHYQNHILKVNKKHIERNYSLSTGFDFFRLPIILDRNIVSDFIHNDLEILAYFEFQSSVLKDEFDYILSGRSLVRVGILFYFESNYISIHNDEHMGDRVNIQFPISLNTKGCIRVLRNGFMNQYFDTIGSLNILGPKVWHDVPPIIKINNNTPLRMNLTFQFEK